jgi:hypothetical protein
VDIRTQKVLAWSGPISTAVTLGALVVGNFLPLPSPAASAEEIAAFYRAHSHAICIASIMFMVSAAIFLGFVTELSVQIKRIEGDHRTFTYLQLAAGAASITPLILTPLAWCVAAFRPEHSPEIIQVFNDLGFITMITATPEVGVQVLAVGLAVLSDKRAQPVFPRWVASASFVCAIGLQCGLLCVLARTGPLAWDGIVAGGIESIVFIPWTLLMCVMLLKAIKQQETEEHEEVGRGLDVNRREVLVAH